MVILWIFLIFFFFFNVYCLSEDPGKVAFLGVLLGDFANEVQMSLYVLMSDQKSFYFRSLFLTVDNRSYKRRTGFLRQP